VVLIDAGIPLLFVAPGITVLLSLAVAFALRRHASWVRRGRVAVCAVAGLVWLGVSTGFHTPIIEASLVLASLYPLVATRGGPAWSRGFILGPALCVGCFLAMAQLTPGAMNGVDQWLRYILVAAPGAAATAAHLAAGWHGRAEERTD
jgi:hypothetical protein